MIYEHHLEVQNLHEWGGGQLGYYSKGHHDPAEFVAAVDHMSADERVEAQDVRHECWRFVPGEDDEGCTGRFLPAKPGTRGAFLVTVWEYVTWVWRKRREAAQAEAAP